MHSKDYKTVLIMGACDKNRRMHSYTTSITNSAQLQIIDVTKNVNELPTFDKSYLDYIHTNISFFIKKKIETIVAVIFYDMEIGFKNAFIKKLNPQCLIINFLKAKMTEQELFEQIALFNNPFRIEYENHYQNGLLLHKSTQDSRSVFRQLPEEIFLSIAYFYSRKINDASFRFFRSLHFSTDSYDNLIENANNQENVLR